MDGGSPAANALAPHRDLRGARQRDDRALSARAARVARHVPRPRVGAGDPSPAGAWRHRDRADADPRACRRSGARGAGSHQLLGLQHARLFRAGRALLRGAIAARGGPRVSVDGAHAARRRPRSHPRRRLQPHGGGRSSRADALIPRHRQRELLPPRTGTAVAVSGFHRNGQHARHAVAARAAAHDGQPAVLGRGHARGRLPFRSGVRARARALRSRSAVVVLRRHPAGSGDLAREAHRRAVGCRPRRLSGRQFPAGLDGMERAVSRCGAPLLARRRGHAARARHAPRRQQRPLRASRTPAACEHQLRHGPRRLHARRPRLV